MAPARIFAFLVFTFLLSSNLIAQTCLQLVDSVDYFKSHQREKTIFYGETLLEKLKNNECNTEIGIIAVYNNLGVALWDVKDQVLALETFKAALAQAKTPEDSINPEYLDIYYNLLELDKEIGNFKEADKYLSYADRIIRSQYGANSMENVLHLFKKGIFYREIGNFDQSTSALSTAGNISQSLQLDDTLRINLLIETGTTFRHFGDLDRSEEKLMEAIELAKQTDQMLYLLAIDRLSTLKIEQGEYSDSENYLLYNLEIKNEKFNDDDILQLETLNGLAMLYYKLNDINSAQKYLEQALDKTKGKPTIRPYMLNNLAAIFMRTGDIEQAKEYFQESADGFRELFGSMHPDYASCLNNLATAHKELGDLAEALNLYMKVLDMDKVFYGDKHQRYATTLNNIGLVYISLGSYSLAGKLLKESKDIRLESLGKNHPLHVKSLNDLGLYYLLTNDTLKAIEIFDEGITIELTHMKDIFPVLTRQQRQLYFKETKNNIERFCSLAFSKNYYKSQWSEKALNHFINTKGALFYASDKMRKLVQNSNDKEIIRIYESWTDTKYKLAQAYLLSEEDRKQRGIDIASLEEEADGHEKRLSLKFKIFSEQDNTSYLTWQDISSVLPDSTVALEVIQYRKYSITSENGTLDQGFEDQSNYVAFILKRDQPLIPIKWDESIDFDKTYNLYTNALKYGVEDPLSYGNFWQPIDDKIEGARKVYISPDGVFYKINPSVLYDAKSAQYVSDKYDIINITSSKDFLKRETKKFIRNATIFGNPQFATLGNDINLNQLPGAEREAADITEILDVRKWKSNTYYFSAATEDKVKNVQGSGVLHIATHGYFDDDPTFTEPLNSSGLYLSKPASGEEDGILSAYEAMNLVLDETSVVVLAACETGLGTVKNGEGVFGLQRAFLVAGADNVLISLVKINDQAARRFMNLYYLELRQFEDPQKAFFEARAKFKEEDKNPYNWGAYLLVSRN